MKTFFLTLSILLSISCGFAQNKKVLATTTMIADMTRQIAGDRLVVESLLPTGSDPHSYESTPEDVKRVTAADLVLMNGLTLEGWISELIENAGTRAQIATVTTGIEPITSADHAGSADPHAWMSAANGLIYAENISKALIAFDPDGKDIYTQNHAQYRAEIETTDRFIAEKIAQIPEAQRILITSHDAFHYFGNRYGLRLEAVMGTSTDADVRTSDIIRLVKIIKTTGVPAIFVESTINPKLLNQIAKDNNIKIGGRLFADSLGEAADSADTYLGMLRRDATLIAEGLRQNKAQLALQNAQNTEGGTPALRGALLGLLSFIILGTAAFFLANKKGKSGKNTTNYVKINFH